MAHDVLWSCLLAHRIGLTALQEILSHVVRNVHCPTLLADILHRCRAPPPPPPPTLPPVPLPTPQYHLHSHHHSNHHHRADGNRESTLLPLLHAFDVAFGLSLIWVVMLSDGAASFDGLEFADSSCTKTRHLNYSLRAVVWYTDLDGKLGSAREPLRERV